MHDGRRVGLVLSYTRCARRGICVLVSTWGFRFRYAWHVPGLHVGLRVFALLLLYAQCVCWRRSVLVVCDCLVLEQHTRCARKNRAQVGVFLLFSMLDTESVCVCGASVACAGFLFCVSAFLCVLPIMLCA